MSHSAQYLALSMFIVDIVSFPLFHFLGFKILNEVSVLSRTVQSPFWLTYFRIATLTSTYYKIRMVLLTSYQYQDMINLAYVCC